MIPVIPEEFYEYLDENEVLKSKDDAPYEVKKKFEQWLKNFEKEYEERIKIEDK
ncbi:hypothetical protein [Thermoanaerobacter sp. YS13]|uniref:hypothetical protein n=1 Tax=Thermoanaerobacter sp. YS13 TaxID=1511746 RepID=UPI000A956B8A|nr:hypothetical protein [Thermoanaerobacter sp. YS13]